MVLDYINVCKFSICIQFMKLKLSGNVLIKLKVTSAVPVTSVILLPVKTSLRSASVGTSLRILPISSKNSRNSILPLPSESTYSVSQN